MADRFYINSELAPGMVVLRGPEAHHLGAVSRLRRGEPVWLFNGDGREYAGRIVEITRRDVTVEVLSINSPQRELPFVLHIAAPLPRGDRAVFLVEKLTELGATKLTILSTERSVVAPREAKIDRLERHVVEASKQCGRNTLMRIEPPRPWLEFVREEGLAVRRLIAHPRIDEKYDSPRVLGERGCDDVVAAVGPEGGFSDEEVDAALASGWQAIDLGPRILRVETAALVLATRLTSS
jgi:16S rRNA (uracil1498-N3)-methyltransferase